MEKISIKELEKRIAAIESKKGVQGNKGKKRQAKEN